MTKFAHLVEVIYKVKCPHCDYINELDFDPVGMTWGCHSCEESYKVVD